MLRVRAECKQCGEKKPVKHYGTWIEWGKITYICRDCLKKKADEQLA